MVTHLPVHILKTFTQRFWGAHAFDEIDKGLYFPWCRSVHTFGMQEPLNLLWLNQRGSLIRYDKNVSPNRVKLCLRAYGVVEIPSHFNAPNYPLGHRFRLRGQALLEAAVVMPVMFLLLFGFLELAIVMHHQQQLLYVTQQATHVGSLTNNDLKIIGAVESYYSTDDVSVAIESKSTLNNSVIPSVNRRYSDTVEVSLSEPFMLRIPFLELEPFSLQATASARVLCNADNPPYQCD